MISLEVLDQLVPGYLPKEFDPPESFREINTEGPTMRIAAWSAHLRERLRFELESSRMENPENPFRQVTLFGTGIFRNLKEFDTREIEKDFPVVEGYQFGLTYIVGNLENNSEQPLLRRSVPLELSDGNYPSPVIVVESQFQNHAVSDLGKVAAYFFDSNRDVCGITAAHVVNEFKVNQRIPITCNACHCSARLLRKNPGLIDAATIKFDCGGSPPMHSGASVRVRSVMEGETVGLYLERGSEKATVLSALSAGSDILSAALPRQFLIDISGKPGDSGTLIALASDSKHSQELLGMYLGDSICRDEQQNQVCYGYGTDLEQVMDIFGVSPFTGEFNE